ncbi:MAG TPA: Gldg family protein [Stellaceae bacterium]|nr:Gldg family protein [Stellaceae bacterium]
MARLFFWRRLWTSPRGRSLAALCCIGVMLIAVNLIAARLLPQRLDLTAERLYTLSPGTRQTLAQIDEPITLRFYYSRLLGDTLPAYGVYAQRVRALLDQYVAAAHGKLRLEVYDPQPFSSVEDRALAFGLQGVPLNSEGEKVYFGLAGSNSTDDQQTIRFFVPNRERLLEYDLTRLVHTLAVPKRTVVGLLTTLPLEGANGPLPLLAQLRQLDEVKELPLTLAAIPEGIDVLMLVQPHKLPDQTLFAIDQFVLRGGAALVFVDPYSEAAARGGAAGDAIAGDLEPLFKAWGVRLVPNAVAADRRDARRVVVPAGQGGGSMHYVAWLDLKGAELNPDDPVTANLREVTLASAGIIERLPGATTKFEPLITTSTDAMQLPTDKIAGLPDVMGLLLNFKPSNTRYVLAGRVTGASATAFPGGPPKAADQPGKPAKPAASGAVLRRSLKPVNVILVADTDLLDERFWAQSENFFGRQVVVPLANNGDFVANAVDVLAGGDDLIRLRSRGTSARPFEVVERIQQAADERYAAEQQTLEKKLKATETKLRELTHGEPSASAAELSPEQATAVEQFRGDLLETRRALRAVRAAQRHDIERLKAILEFCDIALVPSIVAVAAIALGALRRRRWRRLRPAPA